MTTVGAVSAIPYCDDVIPADEQVVPLPDVAASLGVAVTRVHQMLRENKLVAVRRDRVVAVPAAFLDEQGHPLKHLAGTVSVLLDGGFDHTAILRWLFEDDASLPGRPVDVLHGDHAREIVRRAQAMAF
ncbi:DNA-binding protein [Rhodococcus sp. PBTS 1]|nr:DNA-binding protein [Rhodococcus sp. PBTS 1]